MNKIAIIGGGAWGCALASAISKKGYYPFILTSSTKRAEQINNDFLSRFKSLNCPILVGLSRKSFIGQILNQPDAKQRVWGTAAGCAAAIAQYIDILRVHDVKEMSEVCQVADVIFRNK